MRAWAVIVVLAACGGDGAGPVDAPDRAIDAADDAGPGLVEVTVRTGGTTPGPDPTAIVIFTDADGTVVYDGPVGADGTVARALGDGGTVTAIQSDSVLTTIRGVRAGDRLAVGPSPSPLRTWVPSADTMVANFTYESIMLRQYLFVTRCGDAHQEANQLNPPAVTIRFFPDCRAATFDLLALVDTGKYIWQPDIPYVASGTTTLPSTWTPMSGAELTVANLPAGLSRLDVARWTLVAGVPLRTSAGGVSSPAAGPLTLALQYPPGAGDGTVFQAVARRGTAYQALDVHAQAALADGVIDLAQLALPAISGVTTSATGATWTETGGGGFDARVVTLAWSGDNTGTMLWTVVDDGTEAGTVTVPVLPAGHANLDPRNAVNPVVYPAGVHLVDLDQLAGYDAARGYGASLIEPIGDLGWFLGDDYRRAISADE